MINIDRVAPKESHAHVPTTIAEIADYDALLEAMTGCDALIHMAAIPVPSASPTTLCT